MEPSLDLNALANAHVQGVSTPRILEWIEIERRRHASTKYGDDLPGRLMLIEECAELGFGDKWQAFVGNYLRRVELQGLQTQQGRQQLGKAIVTLLHLLETAVAIHGDMPEPGHESGEIRHWRKPWPEGAILMGDEVISVDGGYLGPEWEFCPPPPVAPRDLWAQAKSEVGEDAPAYWTLVRSRYRELCKENGLPEPAFGQDAGGGRMRPIVDSPQA